MEDNNESLGNDFVSDASGPTESGQKSAGQRFLGFLCDHKTTIGCVIALLIALGYTMKKYVDLKSEHDKLLKNCVGPVKFLTKYTTKTGVKLPERLTEQLSEMQNILRKNKLLPAH